MDAGSVWQNCTAISEIEAPFGGNKNSGLGREDSTQGLLEYMKVKSHIQNVSKEYPNYFGID